MTNKQVNIIELAQVKIIELAKENCSYHSEEMRGAYYDGFVRATSLVRAGAYKNWNPDVTFNEDGTFSLELPDGDELRVIPPKYKSPLYAAQVSAKREWVDLEPWQLCDIEEQVGLPIDSHDFETIGNAYIAAFKENNK